MTMDEKELLRQLSERYPPQEESGQQMPDWMMQGGQPAQMPMGMQLLPARPEGAMPGTGFPQSAGADSSLGEGAFDEAEAIGEDEVRKANDLLQKYKAGKAALDKRIIENELWFRMGHWKNYQNKMMAGKPTPSSGWLFNSIANKHADAMEAYPEPNILPREEDDRAEAHILTAIIPCVLEQNQFEKTYSDVAWQKIKSGTGVYKVVWDKGKLYVVLQMAAGEAFTPEEARLYAGFCLENDPLYGDYLDAQLRRLRRRLEGLHRSREDADCGTLPELIAALEKKKEALS